MGTIVASFQANKMREYCADLRELRNRLEGFRTSLNNAWQAEEMVYVNSALEKIDEEISRLSFDIGQLSHDIISTAQEIHREKEARARAKAAKK